MATTLSCTVSAGINFTFTNGLTGSISPTVSAGFTHSQTLTNGTGAANTADLIYAVQTTIAGGANTSLDLAGSLANFFGTTITMARLKFWLIKHTNDTTASSITVGNHAAPVAFFNTANNTVSIRNNGFWAGGCADATGIAITGGSTDGIFFLNADGSNTATVQVILVGASGP